MLVSKESFYGTGSNRNAAECESICSKDDPKLAKNFCKVWKNLPKKTMEE